MKTFMRIKKNRETRLYIGSNVRFGLYQRRLLVISIDELSNGASLFSLITKQKIMKEEVLFDSIVKIGICGSL